MRDGRAARRRRRGFLHHRHRRSRQLLQKLVLRDLLGSEYLLHRPRFHQASAAFRMITMWRPGPRIMQVTRIMLLSALSIGFLVASPADATVVPGEGDFTPHLSVVHWKFGGLDSTHEAVLSTNHRIIPANAFAAATTYSLVIETGATANRAGTLKLVDGGVTTAPAPSSAGAGPGTLLFIGGSLIGLGSAANRRRRHPK
jgi:hypothetical protein